MSSLPRFRVGSGIILDSVPTFPPRAKATEKKGPHVGEKYATLSDLLRKYRVNKDNGESYWPYADLKRIMTKERVYRALIEECRMPQYHQLGNLCEQIVPSKPPDYLQPYRAWPAGGDSVSEFGYIVVFSMLIRAQKPELITLFIEKGIGDNQLPLTTDQGNTYLAGKSGDRVDAGASQGVTCDVIDSVFGHQRGMVTPFFACGTDGATPHYEFPAGTILPWSEISKAEETKRGGYGSVRRVKIERDCHGFHSLLDSILLEDDFFAIKSLFVKDEVGFKKEVEMLARFNGSSHRHLVTLLATYSLDGYSHFIFPYAKSSLDEFWNSHPPRNTDGSFMFWICEQVVGLAEALHIIHSPSLGTQTELVEKFGRHGDLKPENVLLFDSSVEDHGILVISDFGLTAVHRDESKSNVPGQSVPQTPGYRPPECDVKDGTISRAYDIWTMGCLLLEMVCWLLEGREGLQTFNTRRMKLYVIGGAMTTIFFDLKTTADPKVGLFSVKQAVVDYMEELHNHPRCTGYLHDLLRLVHEDMLVVPKDGRIRSTELCKRLREMRDKVFDKAFGRDYLLVTPSSPNPQVRINRREPIPMPIHPKFEADLAALQQDMELFGIKRATGYSSVGGSGSES